jgi:hypothetical protein
MTYQQTLQNIHAAILSKKSTCDIRPDVIGLMRSEADRLTRQAESTMVAQRHPLGFFACKWALGEGRSLRLHLWNKQFEWAQESGWEIHDHTFSFSSLLLVGSLRNRVYDIDEKPSTSGGYSVYEVIYNGSESAMKMIREGIDLTVSTDTNESSEALYSMNAGVLHSSDLVSEHALTVLATSTDEIGPIVPRVISLHRYQLVAFDRSPPLDSQVVDLLTEFAHYLDDTP